jgi:Ca2+-binding RTX toxin-like protein
MTTVHPIPDGPNPNDTITIEFGVWKGALDGNDSLKASADQFTVAGGAGNDTIRALLDRSSILLGTGDDDVVVSKGEATIGAAHGNDRIFASRATLVVTLGGGNDTVHLIGGVSTIVAGNGQDTVRVHSGDHSIHLGSGDDRVVVSGAIATIATGHGNDSIDAVNDGRYSIEAGSGNDTVLAAFGGDGVIHLGHGHNFVLLVQATTSILTDPGGHDTIFGSGSDCLIDAHGKDFINLADSVGKITIGSGHDTIKAPGFIGTVTGHGHDSLKVTESSADVNAGGAHDTISVGGAINLTAGHNDLIKFEDQSPVVSSAHRHAIKEVLANVSGGHDTFVYQYNDDITESGVANSVGIGTDIIADFNKKTDVLVFDDSDGFNFSRADLQRAATVIDHVGGHSITIVIHTSHGAAAGSIVLKGIGTIHHHLASINGLVNHGYHLQFS